MNGLLMAQRRERLGAAERDVMIGFLRGLPVALDDASAAQAWGATALLAERHRLPLYDAT